MEVDGNCDGLITAAPRSDLSFGNDPIFEVNGTGRTFAEMALSKKKSHGHRESAFVLLKPQLEKLLISETESQA